MSVYDVDDSLFGAEGACLDANGNYYSSIVSFNAGVRTNTSSVYEYCYDFCQDISTKKTDLVGLQTQTWDGGSDCACLYNYGTLPQRDPVYILNVEAETAEYCNQVCKDAMPESSTATQILIFNFIDGNCICVYDEEFAGIEFDVFVDGVINGRPIGDIVDDSEGAGPVASVNDDSGSYHGYGVQCYSLQIVSPSSFDLIQDCHRAHTPSFIYSHPTTTLRHFRVFAS